MTYRFPSTAYRMLLSLSEGNKRFSELAEIFPKATVAKLLPELEKFKYVERHVTNTRPLQVSYTITNSGEQVLHAGLKEALKIIRSSIEAMRQVDPKEVRS